MILPDGIDTIGGRLRWIRTHVKHWTVIQMSEELARHLNDKAQNVSDIESGNRTITLQILTAYGRITDVPLDWVILGRVGNAAAAYVLRQLHEALDGFEKSATLAGPDATDATLTALDAADLADAARRKRETGGQQ